MILTTSLTLYSRQDKTSYEHVIRDLGGEVSSDASFDINATHLLCLRLSRNEKMLGSIASGKWVLHCMYLRDSEQEGKFLDVSINHQSLRNVCFPHNVISTIVLLTGRKI